MTNMSTNTDLLRAIEEHNCLIIKYRAEMDNGYEEERCFVLNELYSNKFKINPINEITIRYSTSYGYDNDETIAKRAKHITTTAKKPHPYEFIHDEIGYNYRLPNINAALGCAQMETISKFLESKRTIANAYSKFFDDNHHFEFISEPVNATSNYWLNALVLEDKQSRDDFLRELNDAGVMSRPVWRLMNELTMFSDCQSSDITNAKWLEERVVNLPSSVRLK